MSALLFSLLLSVSSPCDHHHNSATTEYCSQESIRHHEVRYSEQSPSFCTFDTSSSAFSPRHYNTTPCGWEGIPEDACRHAGCCFAEGSCYRPLRPVRVETHFYSWWMSYEGARAKCASLGMGLFCVRHKSELGYLKKAACGSVWVDRSCLTCDEEVEGRREEEEKREERKFMMCAREVWSSYIHPFPAHVSTPTVIQCDSSGNDSEVKWTFRDPLGKKRHINITGMSVMAGEPGRYTCTMKPPNQSPLSAYAIFYHAGSYSVTISVQSYSEPSPRISDRSLSLGSEIPLLQYDTVNVTITFTGYPTPVVTVSSGDAWEQAPSTRNDQVVWVCRAFARAAWLYEEELRERVELVFESVVWKIDPFHFFLIKKLLVSPVPKYREFTLDLNDTLVIDCLGHGVASLSVAEIWWFHSDNLLPHLHNTPSLTITASGPEHSGEVVCMLDNGATTLTLRSLVRVRCAPAAVGVVMVTQGEDHVIFHVPVSRDPWEVSYTVEVERSDGKLTVLTRRKPPATDHSRAVTDHSRAVTDHPTVWELKVVEEPQQYRYRGRVIVVNKFGNSPPSAWSTWSVLSSLHLPSPLSVSLVEVSNTTATLAVSHPEIEVLEVRVVCREEDEMAGCQEARMSGEKKEVKVKLEVLENTSLTNVTLANLTEGTPYTAHIRGSHLTSTTDTVLLSFRTLGPLSRLTSPSNLRAQQVDSRAGVAVLLSRWDYPATSREFLRGFLLTVYRLGLDRSLTVVQSAEVAALSSATLIRQLPLDTVYRVSLVAVERRGGEKSGEVWTPPLLLSADFCPVLPSLPTICSVVLRDGANSVHVVILEEEDERLDRGEGEVICYHGNGSDYHGNVSHTRSGYQCERWDNVAEEGYHDRPLNYCANPAGEERAPWCFRPDGEREVCAVEPCGKYISNVTLSSNGTRNTSHLLTTSNFCLALSNSHTTLTLETWLDYGAGAPTKGCSGRSSSISLEIIRPGRSSFKVVRSRLWFLYVMVVLCLVQLVGVILAILHSRRRLVLQLRAKVRSDFTEQSIKQAFNDIGNS